MARQTRRVKAKTEKAPRGAGRARAAVAETVEWRGRRYWPTWELARIHKTFEGGVWVLRWQKNNATYMTRYC